MQKLYFNLLPHKHWKIYIFLANTFPLWNCSKRWLCQFPDGAGKEGARTIANEKYPSYSFLSFRVHFDYF